MTWNSFLDCELPLWNMRCLNDPKRIMYIICSMNLLLCFYDPEWCSILWMWITTRRWNMSLNFVRIWMPCNSERNQLILFIPWILQVLGGMLRWPKGKPRWWLKCDMDVCIHDVRDNIYSAFTTCNQIQLELLLEDEISF